MARSNNQQSPDPTPGPAEGTEAWRAQLPDSDWRKHSVVDRRTGLSSTPLDRQRGPGRRLSDYTKKAEEGQMTPEQFLFLMAIDGFKKANNKMFPTWTDVLEVIRLLGYRKTMASQIQVPNAEDWTEGADAAANVRPTRPNGERDAA